MRKNSPQSSVGKRALGKVFIFLGVAVITVFLLGEILGAGFAGSIRMIENIRGYFAYSTAALPAFLRGRTELINEIEILKSDIAAKSGDSATIARLLHENEELRALLGDAGSDRILAGVIARPPSVPYDTLILDKGSSDGVVEGTVVYHTHDHALGIVSRVYPTMSLVTLFSSDGVESTVYVYGADVFAYAYGEGGGVIRISLPQGILVQEGDVVVLPSIAPGDLGVVERVVSIPTQPEQSAYLTFPVPLQSLRSVVIAREPLERMDVTNVADLAKTLRERTFFDVPDELRLGTSSTTATTTLMTGTTTR